MRKLNIERLLLVLILIIAGINLTVTVIQAQPKETKPIEQKEGYWVEQTPSLQDIKNMQLTEVNPNEL